MKKLFTPITAVLAALVAAFAVLSPVPAHAEGPDGASAVLASLEKCETDRDALRVSAAGWLAQSEALEELYASSQESRERLSSIVDQWQLRVVDQAATIERQRHRIEHLADRRDHLSSKVRELRAKVRALR